MIYRNFITFITAVILIMLAPRDSNGGFSKIEDLLSILILFMIFFHFNRISFANIKRRFKKNSIDINTRKIYQKIVERNSIAGILFFSLELYVFDLKSLVFSYIRVESFSLLIILFLFILHLSIVWYWGYKNCSALVGLPGRAHEYITENIRFNLVILIPWIVLIVLSDLTGLLGISSSGGISSFAFGILLTVLFLLVFLILSPGLIVKFWDCREMEESPLKNEILEYTKRENVEFKKIMVWNSFGGSLVTAAVIGFFKNFRYLLITPGLLNMLDSREIIAVISHEAGHVKKKHILFYFLIFSGFVAIGGPLITFMQVLILNSEFGSGLLLRAVGNNSWGMMNLMTACISITVFIIYFRFIFGYFMRNFEREADLNSIESGIDPGFLNSAFSKIKSYAGKEKRGSNWHHFTLEERMEFLYKSSKDRSLIKKHKNKIRLSLGSFLIVLLLFTGLSVSKFSSLSFKKFETGLMLKIVKKKIEKDPSDPLLYAAAASFHYELKNWKACREFYEKSLELRPDQPEVLNNLAWLLVTCEDEEFRSPVKGLVYARKAMRLKKSAYIYDTLAEAYLINGKYDNAFRSSFIAFRLASGDRSYYLKQLKKMRKMQRINKNNISL